MVSKSSATRTIRLQNDLWEWLGEEAQRRGVSANGLISTLLEVGRLAAEERRNAEIKPKHTIVKEIEFRSSEPPTRYASTRVLPVRDGDLQLGPTRRPPGSLQKKGKAK